jgi:hypothetical protein
MTMIAKAPCLAELVDRLIAERPELNDVLRMMNEYVLHDGMGDPSRAIMVVRHLVHLLSDGESIFVDCEIRPHSSMNGILEVQRVARVNGKLIKIFAQLSPIDLRRHQSAFHTYLDGPFVVIHRQPITVRQGFGETLHDRSSKLMSDNDVVELFINKQRNTSRIRFWQKKYKEFNRRWLLELTEDNVSIIRMAHRRCVANGPPVNHQATRQTHPYRGPQLQVLPRLLRSKGKSSVLETLTAALPQLTEYGFKELLLAPVDLQSAYVYYGESIDGCLTQCINNHGYWSSGEVGIDPALGSYEDYLQLSRRAYEMGIAFAQDSTFVTCGYPPQLAKFAASNLTSPLDTLMIGADPINVGDGRVFLHEPDLQEEDALTDDVSSQRYAEIVNRLQIGAAWGLPKLNLFCAEVRKASLRRTLWQIEHAGVHSFRVDMAKNMGSVPLLHILRELRRAVSTYTSKSFRATLEYWTTDYRDLQCAATALEDQGRGVYFYDFPLAMAIRQVTVGGADMYDTLSALLASRHRWKVDLCRYIPLLIDHDATFRPIYDGSSETASSVTIGHALCLMLSANAPMVYVGFDHASMSASTSVIDECYADQYSRRVIATLFSHYDQHAPSASIASLFKAFDREGVIEYGDETSIRLTKCEGGGVALSRTYRDRLTGEKMTARAMITAKPINSDDLCMGCALFSHFAGPSVIITRSFSAAVNACNYAGSDVSCGT